MTSRIPTVTLADGTEVPALGQGTWHMGESARRRAGEAAALASGIAMGMTLIDTAEMYGDGGAEEVVGDAIAGRRDQVFVVSKVYPHHAGAKGAIAACERSLRRLRTDRLDLYLLHWRGRIPLAETVGAFERLRRDGKIVRWGVSNFDVDDMRELLALPDGRHCATNQVLWHLGERAAEFALAPECRRHGIPLMAYCPLGEGGLLHDRRLRTIAKDVGASPAAVALAWLIARGAIAIPKSTDVKHLRENRAAVTLKLSSAALAAIDANFPPPTRATPLGVI
ncbi:MAG TPA: aldo/keto reductase [Casimicrobiaceae bacterium]|nr:aldo/keto reductase [Casimicrobiaceae bacterium]